MTEKDTEKIIRDHLIGKKIQKIEFYDYNNLYLVFDPEHQWVVDFCIYIELNEGFIMYYFDGENECVEFSTEKNIEDIDPEGNAQALGAFDIQGLKILQGKEITDIHFRWSFYRLLDESFELTEKKYYLPTEMILVFENGHRLQIASVQYAIDKKTKKMINIEYDLVGELLVTLFNDFHKG